MPVCRHLIAGFLSISAAAFAENQGGLLQRAQQGSLLPRTIITPGGVKLTPGVSGGMLHGLELGASPRSNAAAVTSSRSTSAGPSNSAFLGLSRGTLGCGARNTDGNVRVNQDCGFRPQNETSIKVNPNDFDNLIGGMNDYRTGEGFQGFAFSIDGGRSWGDGLVPFTNHRNDPQPGHTVLGGPGTFHTYEAYSDPGLAWDSQGNAFFSAVNFDRTTFASGVFVTISPQVKGAFYAAVPSTGPRFMAAEDNNPFVVHDKPFVTADFYPGSRFRDNVYVTWTVFDESCKDVNNNPAYCKSPIYFSRSSDHATTWTQPKPISGNNPALCFFGDFFGNPADLPNDCNFDQGSDPIVLPNGDLVVTFNNGNTPAGNPNAQQLAVVSHDAGDTWVGPFKVGDDVVVGEPQCADAPGECIPGADIRTNDFPRIAVNRKDGHLFVVWQDYRTGEFDIHLSASYDGGYTWREAAAPVNPDQGKDHYFPAVDTVSPYPAEEGYERHDGRKGDLVVVSYFRTGRVPGENVPLHLFTTADPGVRAENTDYAVAAGQGLATPYAARRVAPESPPPSFIGFNGDYSGVAVVGTVAHPIWSDARNQAPPALNGPDFQDEDVFTDAVSIPVDDDRGH